MSHGGVRVLPPSDRTVRLIGVTALAVGFALVVVMMAEEQLVAAGWSPVELTAPPGRNLEIILLAVAAAFVARRPHRDLVRPVVALSIVIGMYALVALVHGASAGPALGVIAMLIIIVLAPPLPPHRLERLILAVLLVVVVVSVGLYVAGIGNVGSSRRLSVGPLALLPDIGRARGLFTWASDLGIAATLLILVSLRGMARATLRRSMATFAIVMGLVTIVVADALTALLALLVALLFGAIVGRLRAGPFVSASVVTVLLFPFVVALLGRPSLTGRAVLWRRILEESSLGELLLGAGHRAMDGPFGDRVAVEWGPVHAHNAVLDVLVTTGVLGLLAYLVALATMLVLAMRVAPVAGPWAFVGVVLWILNGLTEIHLDRLRPSLMLPLFLVMLLLSQSAALASREVRRPDAALSSERER